jgi:hypothetical protein
MSIIQKIDFNSNIFNDTFYESAYYYWCDKLELHKLISFGDNFKYIPCYPYENINYTDMIGKNVLIFLKNPKILYGILKIESILIKEEREKNYLDYYKEQNNSDNSYNSDNLDKSIIIDKKLYLNLIKKYNMVEIPSLFYIKFDYINIFEFEIDIKSYNQYLNLQNKNIEEFEFKYPKIVKPKHILKSYYKYFQTFLLDYIKYLEKKLISETEIKENNNLLIQDNISSFSDLDSNIDSIIENRHLTNSNNEEIVDFSIPILWNGCEKILKKFKKQKIDKELIFDHWNNCEKCEIINNNQNKFEIRDKKIVIKNIESKNNFTIIQNIIDNYKNISKFSYPKINSDFEFDNKKTNIICCFESNSIYKNCFFILDKLKYI